MATPKVVTDIAQLRQQGIRSAHQFDERMHGWLGMLAGAVKQANKPDSVITAAAIAYFALFSLFPLILLSIAIASFSLGSLMDQHLIVHQYTPAVAKLVGRRYRESVRGSRLGTAPPHGPVPCGTTLDRASGDGANRYRAPCPSPRTRTRYGHAA